MSHSDGGSRLPKSMRRKRILDLAAENPDASLEELAEKVPSATIDLVRNVLEEHGDPADKDDDDSMAKEQGDTEQVNPSSDHSTAQEEGTDTQDIPSPDDLSTAQYDVLAAIAQNPDASQRELAEQLDVSAATISNRANSITGFQWENREAFAKSVLENSASDSESDTSDSMDQATNGHKQVNELAGRITALEQEIHKLTEGQEQNELDEPELVHKIVHACMQYDEISQEEELRILENFMQ